MLPLVEVAIFERLLRLGYSSTNITLAIVKDLIVTKRSLRSDIELIS
jgi:hypothetical protein